MSADVDDLLAELLACEERVWAALVAGDAAADEAALAADFWGVYPDGFADRAAHAAQLDTGPSVAWFRICRARARPLGADFGLLSYRAEYARVGAANGASEAMFVTSIWQRSGATWANIFSQDTPRAAVD